MTTTHPTTPDQGDERRAEAYIAAHDAFNSALPAGLRGHSEWCDRFDAARAAFDRAFVMSHPEYGVQKVGVEGHLPYKFKGERADIRLALAPSESVAVSASPSALPAQAVGEVTDAMRKAFDDRNNSLEADERDGIIAAILALAAPMPQPEPTSKGEEEVVIVRSGNFPPGWDK